MEVGKLWSNAKQLRLLVSDLNCSWPGPRNVSFNHNFISVFKGIIENKTSPRSQKHYSPHAAVCRRFILRRINELDASFANHRS